MLYLKLFSAEWSHADGAAGVCKWWEVTASSAVMHVNSDKGYTYGAFAQTIYSTFCPAKSNYGAFWLCI